MADPSNEVCPNFHDHFFEAIREQLVQASGDTEEEVIHRLVRSWTLDHDRRVEAWNEEQAAIARTEAEALQAQRLQEEETRRLQEAEAEKERLDAEKKKPKMNGFDNALPVSDTIIPRPAQYAIQKINNFDYVELWYFSPEGCKDASRNPQSIAEDAFGLTKVDDAIALRPLSAFKASRSALADHELSFPSFLRAKNSLLTHISKANWPQTHVDALSLFFWHLENHQIRNNSNIGDLAILHYASRVRQDWHDSLKREQGFNIGIINEILLHSISEELWDKLRSRLLPQVCRIFTYADLLF